MNSRISYYYSFVIVVILAVVNKSFARCDLEKGDLNDNGFKRVYLKFNFFGLSLQRQDYLERGETLRLYCNEINFINALCLQNDKFSVKLPVQGICTNPLKVKPIRVSDAECPFTSYQIGYSLTSTFLRIYSICYDLASFVPVYVKHDVYQSNLQGEDGCRSDYFATDRIISGTIANLFKRENYYKAFNRLLGINQAFIDNQKGSIDRGHLAPCIDFVAYDQKRETFRYLNVVPQFIGPNRMNWKRIEAWIKTLPRNNEPITVVTGTFDVLELPHSDPPHQMVRMYLHNNNQLPIPKWMYKVIASRGQCIVIVTYNYHFTTAPSTLMCNAITCPAGLNLSREISHGYTYCCDYNNFVPIVGEFARIC